MHPFIFSTSRLISRSLLLLSHCDRFSQIPNFLTSSSELGALIFRDELPEIMNSSLSRLISSSSTDLIPALSRPSSTGRRKIRYRPKRVSASGGNWTHDRGYGGRSVDESMIVLRKRIHETKMAERNYEPPAEWTAWEKRYYASYDSHVCEALGLLQRMLMNTRPSVALGAALLVALSVPTAVFTILFHLVGLMTNGSA